MQTLIDLVCSILTGTVLGIGIGQLLGTFLLLLSAFCSTLGTLKGVPKYLAVIALIGCTISLLFAMLGGSLLESIIGGPVDSKGVFSTVMAISLFILAGSLLWSIVQKSIEY